MTNHLRSQFIRHLFDSAIVEALSLLQLALDDDENGDLVVLECITAWQDFIDSSASPFTPLLECLKENDNGIICLSLQLVNKLLLKTADPTRLFRMLHELQELHYADCLNQLENNQTCEEDILAEINIWRQIQKNGQAQLITDSIVPEEEELGEEVEEEEEEEYKKQDKREEEEAKKEKEEEEEHRNKRDNDEIVDDKLSEMNDSGSGSMIHENEILDSSTSLLAEPYLPPPPPPPPPIIHLSSHMSNIPPPPPPPILNACGHSGMPPPPPPPVFGQPFAFAQPKIELPESMKPKRVPDKTLKMKTLMWSKLAPSAVVGEGKDSVWSRLANESRGFSLDFEMIEGMFSIAPAQTIQESAACTNRRKETIVDLLTPKRSQNVSITLKRFKDLEGLITNLQENNHEAFEAESLKTLKSILPDADEIEALRRYSGDINMLAPPCSFFLHILNISEYSLRIDCMLYRSEFTRVKEETVPQLSLLLKTCTELSESEALRRLLLVLVNIGNYLNGSTAHGNAAGFKLNSLWRMIDLKAAKGGSTLLHAVAKMDQDLLNDLENELSSIQQAAQISTEELKTSLKQFAEQGKKLKHILEDRKLQIFESTLNFIDTEAENLMESVNRSLDELTEKTEHLANYFCENPISFKLDECLMIFNNFIKRLHVAVQENKEREERAAKKTHVILHHEDSLTREGKENPDSFQRSESYGQQQLLYQTLEAGSHSSWSRRRSSQRNILDHARERGDGESKLRKIFRDAEAEERKVDNAMPDNENKTLLSPDMPRFTRRPRLSVHYEKTSDLTDYIQSLQGSIIPQKTNSIPESTEVEDGISVSIPSESDGCVSTPESSPKSASDEGFESEKDKDSVTNDSSRTLSEEKKLPSLKTPSSSGRIDEKPSKLIKPPRLVSVTTSAIPTKAAVAKGTVSSPAIKRSQRTPLQKQKDVDTLKQQEKDRIDRTAEKPSVNKNQNSSSSKLRQPLVEKVNSPNVVTKIPPRTYNTLTSPRKNSLPVQRAISTTTMSATLKTLPNPKLVRKNLSSDKPPTKPSVLRKPAASLNVSSRPTIATSNYRSISSNSSSNNSSIDLKTPVSTSSRPALIKTGSVNQRTNIQALETLEKPKPLKKTMTATGDKLKSNLPSPGHRSMRPLTGIPKPLASSCRPKWV